MNSQISVQGPVIEVKQDLKAQLARYMEQQQPESTQTFHKRMKRLEAADVGIMAAALIVAMYVSIAWKSVNPLVIPIAWFLFAASAGPMMALIGIHSILLRASPPIVLPGKVQKLVAGSGAVWTGWGFILSGLAVAAFWGFFAYAVGTFNMALIAPLVTGLGVLMGVGMAVSIVLSFVQKLIRSR